MTFKSAFQTWIGETENKLLVLTIIAVAAGLGLGFGLRQYDLSSTAVLLISFPGEILMSMLKCVILPMIITSLISSMVQLDHKTSSRIGLLTLVFYICSTALAVSLSVVLVMTIKPGSRFSANKEPSTEPTVEADRSLDTILDLFRRVFPENIFQATMQQIQTSYVEVENKNSSNLTKNVTTYERQFEYTDNSNVLGIVLFCIFFGFVASKIGTSVEPVMKFFIAMEQIIMRMLMGMLWYSPFGIFSLVAGNILEVDNMEELFSALGMFILCSILGLMLHFFLVLPLVYVILVRKNPYIFLWRQFPAWVNVLGPSSSSAALPITSRCLEEKNHVDYRVSRFVLPVGATINIDGAALYEAMATVFVAQLHHMPLSVGRAIAITLTVTLSSVGSSSLPGAGLISVLPLLAPIPVTAADVAMLITVDWFIDRIRTCNNVMGDSIAAGVVNHFCGGPELDASSKPLAITDDLHVQISPISSNDGKVYPQHHEPTVIRLE